ncbi:Uncharacterised protein at_DN2258 [Pycnogonum litorale]
MIGGKGILIKDLKPINNDIDVHLDPSVILNDRCKLNFDEEFALSIRLQIEPKVPVEGRILRACIGTIDLNGEFDYLIYSENSIACPGVIDNIKSQLSNGSCLYGNGRSEDYTKIEMTWFIDEQIKTNSLFERTSVRLARLSSCVGGHMYILSREGVTRLDHHAVDVALRDNILNYVHSVKTLTWEYLTKYTPTRALERIRKDGRISLINKILRSREEIIIRSRWFNLKDSIDIKVNVHIHLIDSQFSLYWGSCIDGVYYSSGSNIQVHRERGV